MNGRFACRRFVVACSEEQLLSRSKGSRIKQRETFNCNAVTTAAWADPRRAMELGGVVFNGGTEPTHKCPSLTKHDAKLWR